jgi:hypothetical protein
MTAVGIIGPVSFDKRFRRSVGGGVVRYSSGATVPRHAANGRGVFFAGLLAMIDQPSLWENS